MEYLENIKTILESLLLAANEPVSIERLCKIIGAEKDEIRIALDELESEYETGNRGFRIRKVAGGYSLYTNPDYSFYVDRLLQGTVSRRLSQAALEVLAIITYKQPITRAEINNVRGVSSETVLNSLIEKGLIRESGREKTAGMPILYETTTAFLEALGINNLNELPELSDFAPDDETVNQIKEQLTSSLSNESLSSKTRAELA